MGDMALTYVLDMDNELINKLREDERIGSRYSNNQLHEMICRVDGITFEPRHYFPNFPRDRTRKAAYVGVYLNDFGDDEEDISSDIAAFLDVPIPHENIWAVMTKTERRRFFEHNCFEIEKADCKYRIRALKHIEREEALATAKTIEIQNKNGVTAATRYRFYGVRYRMETCATEIANEYYGSDARKMIYRVNEALNEQVEGWQLATFNGKPQQQKNFAGVYGNQKRIFERTGEPPEIVTATDNDDDDFFDADDEVYAES